MLSYIIRRLLLLPPTLIGITAIVFFVNALSPGGIGASLDIEGSMRPAERAAKEKYYDERYGLDRPKVVQYGHWLNNVMPIGLATYPASDPGVVKASDQTKRLQVPLEQEIAQLRSRRATLSRDDPKDAELLAQIARLDAKRKSIHVAPRAGDVIFSRPRIKLPDLGESFSKHRPVSALILEAIPVSLILQLVSLPLTYLIAVLSGIYAARHRGKLIDIGTGFVLIALYSVPLIWVGVLFIGFLCNNEYVHWFPANGLHNILSDDMNFLPHLVGGHFQRGWLLDAAWHLVGPAICISYGEFAVLSKLTRGSLLDTLSLDFVRTARAKGLAERVVLFRHAFRNSLIPLITVAAYILPALVSGAILVETIFGLQGMGNLTITAIDARDRELLMGTTLMISFLTLIGYLLADIAYAVADPRVSYDA